MSTFRNQQPQSLVGQRRDLSDLSAFVCRRKRLMAWVIFHGISGKLEYLAAAGRQRHLVVPVLPFTAGRRRI